MKKRRKANKNQKQQLNATQVFAKAVISEYSKEIDQAFYTTNSLAEKKILAIKSEGDVYKVVKVNGASKIVARIDDAVYNFPALVASPGAKAKLKKAYQELKERENLESVK